MGSEWWIEAYECAVEDVADIEGLDLETARRWVDDMIEKDSCYLNDYICAVVEAHKEN